MILAGDIGGTKTVLTLIDKDDNGVWQCLAEQTFASGEFTDFNDILTLFLANSNAISAACFGIAGPVIEERCQTTNLPWIVDAAELKVRLGTPRVKLLNDLEAMALGMLQLPNEDFVDLNPQAQAQPGNIAVIAAGTGLGEALLYWDGQRYHALATEGGHTDFAPLNQQQDQLLTFLRERYPEHVSCERLLSGIGFSNLYDFLLSIDYGPACPAVPSPEHAKEIGIDRSAVISRLGVNGEDAVCQEVVRLFAELYGAEAGNLALTALATGGVYIGGGIGPKIRPALEAGDFMQAFSAKGRFKNMLDNVPVKLALNPKTPLLGAMYYFTD